MNSNFSNSVSSSAHSRLDAGLGAAEQRTEPYIEYGDGAAQAGTTPSAKSTSGVGGFAGEQASATGIAEHTGFPNPATDTNIVPLDLTGLLIKHPPSTFFMRIDSNEWERFGVFIGDVAIIDRALKPKPIDLVIWWDTDTFTISKFHKLPMDTAVWGVVTAIIHRYRS